MSEVDERLGERGASSAPPAPQVFTGGYDGHLNDPYQYARDNGLTGPECDVVAYVTRHRRGEPSGQKYGVRDILAAIATLSRIAIDDYRASHADVVAVVGRMFRNRGLPAGFASLLDEVTAAADAGRGFSLVMTEAGVHVEYAGGSEPEPGLMLSPEARAALRRIFVGLPAASRPGQVVFVPEFDAADGVSPPADARVAEGVILDGMPGIALYPRVEAAVTGPYRIGAYVTHVESGGKYQVVADARDLRIKVNGEWVPGYEYRDLAPGQQGRHYVRTQSDFEARMRPWREAEHG